MRAVYSPLGVGANPSGAVWPSLFGLVAPDEDMAETFKLFVLSKSGLKGLTVRFSGTAGDSVDVIQSVKTLPNPLAKKANHLRDARPLE